MEKEITKEMPPQEPNAQQTATVDEDAERCPLCHSTRVVRNPSEDWKFMCYNCGYADC